MFSVKQKREIADAVQSILRSTHHPELPSGEISFKLHVEGSASWSYADIENNGAVPTPGVNPFNEVVFAHKVGPISLAEVELAEQYDFAPEEDSYRGAGWFKFVRNNVRVWQASVWGWQRAEIINGQYCNHMVHPLSGEDKWLTLRQALEGKR